MRSSYWLGLHGHGPGWRGLLGFEVFSRCTPGDTGCGEGLVSGSWEANVYTRLTLEGRHLPCYLPTYLPNQEAEKYMTWSSPVGGKRCVRVFVQNGWLSLLGRASKTSGLFEQVVSLSFWPFRGPEWQEGTGCWLHASWPGPGWAVMASWVSSCVLGVLY